MTRITLPRIPGSDIINDNAGTDTLDLTQVITSDGFIIDLAAGMLSGDGTQATITGTIETIIGGSGSDEFTGKDDVDQYFDGQYENDSLTGADGNETLLDGYGHDTLNGGTGNDRISGGADEDSLNGGEGNDTIDGGDGDDTIVVGIGVDSLYGGAGTDTFIFSSNTLVAGTGLDGGDGSYNVLNFQQTNSSLSVDLSAGTMSNGSIPLTGVAGIEHVLGSSRNDTLRGDTGSNSLFGGNGDDVIYGGDGNDFLFGGAVSFNSAYFFFEGQNFTLSEFLRDDGRFVIPYRRACKSRTILIST